MPKGSWRSRHVDVVETIADEEQATVSRRNEPGPWRVQRFRRVYDDGYTDLVGYCRRRIEPAMVDDIVAETFTIAWRRLDDLPDPARPWLFAVARNLMRNRRRSVARADVLTEVIVGELSTRVDEAGAEGLEVDEIRALVEALHALGDDDREVIRLVTWEAASHADAAVVLGCSVNAVAIRLHRARGRLRKRLERDPRWGSGTDGPSTATSRKVAGDHDTWGSTASIPTIEGEGR